MDTERQVVHRVEDGMDRQGVEATTYQMRNPFKQLRDGLPTALDVFNYLHHHHIAKAFARPGNHVLDVCCGRGIMLPLLRYHAPKIASYTGVDIEPANAEWLTRRVTDGKYLSELKAPREARPVGTPDTGEPFAYTRETYYPFPTYFVESNAAAMTEPVWNTVGELYDLIIYTQSIEHMHPDAGTQSLRECAKLARANCRLILSGPNTPADQDGYETRYRAHVYEWKRQELVDALEDAGWIVLRQWGLTISSPSLELAMDAAGLGEQLLTLRQCVPTEWLMPVLAPLFPEQCDEIAILARWPGDQMTLGQV